MAADLLPCAWCGSAAMTERPHPGCSMVYCSNLDCPVHASTGWCDESDETADVIWNRRAPSRVATPATIAERMTERLARLRDDHEYHAERALLNAPSRTTPPAAPAAAVTVSDAMLLAAVEAYHRLGNISGIGLHEYPKDFRERVRLAIQAALAAAAAEKGQGE